MTRKWSSQCLVVWAYPPHFQEAAGPPRNCPFLLLPSSPPKAYVNRLGLRTEQTCLYTLAFAHDKNQALPPTNSLGDSKTAMFSKNLQEAILSPFHKCALLQDARAALAAALPRISVQQWPTTTAVRRQACSQLLGDQTLETTAKPQQPSSVFTWGPSN